MTEQLELLGVDPLADALAWATVNPQGWRWLVDMAKADRGANIDPSTRLYLCILRRPHFAHMLGLERMAGDPVLVNDHLSAPLARLLNRYYPYLNCPTRKARSDP